MFQNHQHLHHMHARQHGPELEELIKRDPVPDPQTTVLSVVYVTASPTFTGSVGGYTTIGVDPSSSDIPQATQVGTPQAAGSSTSSVSDFSDASTFSSLSAPPSTGIFYSVTGLVSSTSTSASSSSLSSVSLASVATSLTTSTAAISYLSTANPNTAIAPASTSSSISNKASTATSSGMSTGAKTGIAVGVIVILVAVAAGVLFAYWKKKKQHEEYAKQDNEKSALAATAAAAAFTKSPSPAPRLSLRPMSRLMRFSGGNLLNNVNATNVAQNGPGRNLTPSPNMAAAVGPRAGSPWERRAGESSGNIANPFSDPQSPFSDPENAAAPPPTAGPGAFSAGAAGAAAGVAASQNPSSRALRTTTPEPTVGAVAASSPEGQNNVHRVQLDFKPSMDDELELKAGQLVRMLHEYDDGWALCIRLDRSQQGVAPRTCLSQKPCKPRPANGSIGPGARGPSMNGPPIGHGPPARIPPNGRMSPAMGRPDGRMSPALGRPDGRMSPAMSRPDGRMSPAMSRPDGRMSPAMGRPGPPQGQPMSPASLRGPPRMAPQFHQNNSNASINQFNQGPRPLSPGPGPRSPGVRGQRSQSPGPYGASQGPRLMAPQAQRRRSNSANGVLMPPSRMSPAPLNGSRLNTNATAQWPLSTTGSRPA